MKRLKFILNKSWFRQRKKTKRKLMKTKKISVIIRRKRRWTNWITKG